MLLFPLKPLLSKTSRIHVADSSLTAYSEGGKLIASVPCIDPRLVDPINTGLMQFSSLTGHRLFRWEVKMAFQNWIQEVEDSRLICTSGGYGGIANLIGCGRSNKAAKEVKAILYAQAHGKFSFPDGSQGNMIILNENERHRNGEPSIIHIILGEIFLPNYVHKLPKGGMRRLIPITELPPLIGSPNIHAAQAMLQLFILEEFSNQSHLLAKNGSIHLPYEKWCELADQANLTRSSLHAVIRGWTENEHLNQAFLQKQENEYTLAPSHSLVMDFLEHQGRMRNDGSVAGKRSASAKKVLQKNKYRPRKKKKSIRSVQHIVKVP